jgi:hypothetical protein
LNSLLFSFDLVVFMLIVLFSFIFCFNGSISCAFPMLVIKIGGFNCCRDRFVSVIVIIYVVRIVRIRNISPVNIKMMLSIFLRINFFNCLEFCLLIMLVCDKA